MVRNQLILDVNEEIIFDGFAGGGGWSCGEELALGRHVDHAANHDAKALGMHRINHPQTIHHCEDIWGIDPDQVREGRPVGHAHFSPDCKHHSKAKGGKPLDKKIRGLVLVMYRWAKCRSRVMTMENVEEIADWGPLDKDGYPIKHLKGRTWQAFLDGMKGGIDPDHPDLPYFLELLGGTVSKVELINGFGYDYDVKQLRACDYGAPTIRKRLFAIFRCDGKPIVWPERTHAHPSEADKLGLKPWRPVAECIDWHLPCPSIFLSKKEARLARCRRPLADSTLRRIAAGIDRYVLRAQEPFFVSLTHHGGNRIESVSEPAATITAAHRGEKALVKPVMAPFIGDANRPQEMRNSGADEPMHTQCAGIKGGHFQLTAATLVGAGGPTYGGKPKPVDVPLNTLTTESHTNLAAVSLVKMKGDAASHPGVPITDPGPTATAGGRHQALSAVYLAQNNFDRVGKDVRDPMTTVTAKGHQQPVIAAYMAQQNGGFNENPGHDMRDPASTISSRGSQQQVVGASMAAYYGSEADGQGIEEPCRSVTAKPRFAFSRYHAIAPPMTEDQVEGARRVAAFLRKYGVEFEGEFATVRGYVIVDIGLRMLTPRELFRAQGFPESYVIDRAWVIDPHTGSITEEKLTKEEQIRMCGNSVPPPFSEAIVSANVPELARWDNHERFTRKRTTKKRRRVLDSKLVTA